MHVRFERRNDDDDDVDDDDEEEEEEEEEENRFVLKTGCVLDPSGREASGVCGHAQKCVTKTRALGNSKATQ
jgi:hypothetical protein